MRGIVEAKEKFDSLSSKIIDGTVIRVFDFDGTLYNSPIPNPELWDKNMIGTLMGEVHRGGLGWFQNPITLNDKYLDNSTFNEDVVEEVFKSMNDPDSITVLLTGRTTEYAYLIRSILDARGLVFDHYGFKPIIKGGKIPTFQFKQEFITNLVKEYQPDAIEFWEDRLRHVKKFNELIDILGLKGEVHYVDENPCYMDESLEREVVDILKKDAQKPFVESGEGKTPIYYAAFLDTDSHYKLLNQLGSEIPSGWKVFAHHMTIVPGKPRDPAIADYLNTHRGQTVRLVATELGVSDDAIAVKISTDIPTTNVIPHVTIAVPQGGKPVNSNKISDWVELNQPIELTAMVNAFYG